MDQFVPTLGAIPSPHDYRDAYASATPSISFELPPSFNTEMPGVVLNQAKIPACVSHSVAQALQLYHFRRNGQLINFSPRFLDVLAKRFDGQPLDGGTIPRLVFKLAVQYGCATIDALPNDTSLPLAQYRDDSVLTTSVFADAEKHKIPGFIRVNDDFNSFRQAAYLHGAVSALMRIGSEWWLPSWNSTDIDPLRTPVSSVGGHQIVVKGWSDTQFDILRNSWSDKWANKGEAKFDFSAWQPYIVEGWTVAEVPKDVKNFLAALPPSSDFHYQWNKNMAFGQSSEEIKFAQIALMILGFLVAIPPEQLGIYGPKTAAAVKAYQISKKISPQAPNSIGPKTRAALNADFSI